MNSMTRIWERLFVGDRRDAELLSKFNPFRITTVITLCEDEVLNRNSAINYIHIPVADPEPVAVGVFDSILDAIAENVRWGTVLIHCGSGWSRSPVMAAAWMHAVGYKNLDAALEEISASRPVVASSQTLLASVRAHLR
jgi:protein-tyrosine phosphatase